MICVSAGCKLEKYADHLHQNGFGWSKIVKQCNNLKNKFLLNLNRSHHHYHLGILSIAIMSQLYCIRFIFLFEPQIVYLYFKK